MKRSGNNQFNALWTEDEIQKLRNVYGCIFKEEAEKLFPGRSAKSVCEKAKVLGLKKGERKVFFPNFYCDDAEGGYVSGFVDGEGWFCASVLHKRGRWNFNPKFGVSLRVDDEEILWWLTRYFECGNVSTNHKLKSPRAVFVVSKLYDLLANVIPHFERYPLRAKKRHDYVIWKEMVMLQAQHFRKRWSANVSQRMKELYDQLQDVRALDVLYRQ